MSAKRSDGNQSEISEALRAAGCTVFDTHELGKGFPDIVVGLFGRNYLMEIKNGKGKLTEPEKKFFTNWTGQADVVRTVEEALRVVGRLE